MGGSNAVAPPNSTPKRSSEIAPRMTFREWMKRRPALSVVHVMAPPPVRGGPGFSMRKMQVAAKAMQAKAKKKGVVGPNIYSTPPSAGPAMRAADQADEYQVMALAKCSLGTRFGVNACAAGLAKARAEPATKTQA